MKNVNMFNVGENLYSSFLEIKVYNAYTDIEKSAIYPIKDSEIENLKPIMKSIYNYYYELGYYITECILKSVDVDFEVEINVGKYIE